MLSNKPQKWKSKNSLKYPIKIIQKPVIDLLAQTLISEKKEEISIFNMRKAKNKKKEKGKHTKIFFWTFSKYCLAKLIRGNRNVLSTVST